MNDAAQFTRAALAHDSQEPPDDHDCKADGHDWRKHRVAKVQGEDITEYKYRFCGETTVQ